MPNGSCYKCVRTATVRAVARMIDLPVRIPPWFIRKTESRQKRSVPMLTELHQKLLLWKEQLLPKHSMASAVNYVVPTERRV